MTGFLLDLVFPKICQGCFCEGTYLCLPCQAKIQPCESERCPVCSKNSLLGRTHNECRSAKAIALDALMVAADYEDETVRNLIWNLKYNSIGAIGEILAVVLTDFFVSRELTDYFARGAVVPVPMHKSKRRKRGFNQAELIASEFAKKSGLEYLPILEKTKNTKSQVELEREERLENVRGSFRAGPMPSSPEKRKIILIDDVATTGTTLNECAKALKQQQPSEIWGLVVARN